MGIKIEKANNLIIFIVAVAVILGLVILFESIQSQRAKEIRVGGLAPNFTLRTIDGKTVSLADYKGKVVLVNIWATWCPPCQQEVPSMVRLYKEMKGKDFEILAVSIDDQDLPNTLISFARVYEMGFPILMDSRSEVAKLYRTTGVPESFLVDRNGIVQHKVVGPDDWGSPTNVARIKSLLAQM